MTAKLSGPMVAPRDGGAPTQLVVLLHGYGSDGQDLIGLVPYWRDLLPGALFVAPNAPMPCRDNPGGYQWFPIEQGRAGYRPEGAAAARPVIAGFLADLWAQTGLGPRHTILAGFSQGAMMALHVGLSLNDRVKGVVAFSGALIAPPELLAGTGPKPPVCLIHGDRDPVVDPSLSLEAAALLTGMGFAVSSHTDPGSGHTITAAGLAFAGEFIRALGD